MFAILIRPIYLSATQNLFLVFNTATGLYPEPLESGLLTPYTPSIISPYCFPVSCCINYSLIILYL